MQHFCFADGAGLCCKYSRLGRGWFLFLVEFAPLLITKLFLVEQLLEKGFLYLGCAAEVAFIYVRIVFDSRCNALSLHTLIHSN